MNLTADVYLDVDQQTVFAAIYRDDEQVGVSELGKLASPMLDEEFNDEPWRAVASKLLGAGGEASRPASDAGAPAPRNTP